MPLFWKEAYIGTNQVEFTRILARLNEHDIETRERVDSLRSRMAENVIMGGDPLILNDTGAGASGQTYYIFVRGKDLDGARAVIEKDRRGEA